MRLSTHRAPSSGPSVSEARRRAPYSRRRRSGQTLASSSSRPLVLKFTPPILGTLTSRGMARCSSSACETRCCSEIGGEREEEGQERRARSAPSDSERAAPSSIDQVRLLKALAQGQAHPSRLRELIASLTSQQATAAQRLMSMEQAAAMMAVAMAAQRIEAPDEAATTTVQ
jgi:hypothetical protein